MLLAASAACAHAPEREPDPPPPAARAPSPPTVRLAPAPKARAEADSLAGAPPLAPIEVRRTGGPARGQPERVTMEESLGRLSHVLASLRVARDPGPKRRPPPAVVGEWERLLEDLDRYLDQPPRETPPMELVRAKVTVETELESDGAAWRLPGALVERLHSRVAYLDHRIEEARARLMPVPAGKEIHFEWPVDPVVVNSPFGWRDDPIDGKSRFHYGVDLEAHLGEVVVAAAGGVVTWAGWAGGHGKHVEVRHAGGWVTRYSHLSRILVRKGDHVGRGDVVGLAGSTGRSTGPHLHFEVWRFGDVKDPFDACGEPALAGRDDASDGTGMGGGW